MTFITLNGPSYCYAIKTNSRAIQGHHQLSLKCKLPNRMSFDVFDLCFCKVETRHMKRNAVALSV